MTRQHDQFEQESLYFLLLIKTVFLSFLCGICVVQFVPVNRRKWCQKKKYALKFELICCMTFPFSDICPTGTTFAREHLRPFECPLCKDHQNSVVLIQHNICSLFSFSLPAQNYYWFAFLPVWSWSGRVWLPGWPSAASLCPPRL